jgi:hypothetical protein
VDNRKIIEERCKDAPFLGHEETLRRNVLPSLKKPTAAFTGHCRLFSMGTLSVNKVTFLLF